MPKISVIIPTYNNGRYIGEAIDSVLSQTFKDLEIIVVDDGSTDDTEDICKGYKGVVSYLYQVHYGVSKARNLGIASSRGEFIAFLDADDIWYPQKLELQMIFLKEHNDVCAVVCDAENFDTSGVIDRSYFEKMTFTPGPQILENGFKVILEKNFCLLSCTLIRKACFDKAGLLDEKIILGEDMEFYLRVTSFSSIGVIKDVLVKKRLFERRTKSSLIGIDAARDNMLYILNKISCAFPGIIVREKIDIAALRARTYFRFGYAYFMQDEFVAARSNFRQSICQKASLSALKYYMLTFLGKRTIICMRRLKSLLISSS